MSAFVELKALAGTNYVRASDVVAVQYSDPQKCIVILAGGASMPVAEPAAQVVTRIDAALTATPETPHGHASR